MEVLVDCCLSGSCFYLRTEQLSIKGLAERANHDSFAGWPSSKALELI